jgi:hypothetical protein
MGTDIEITLCSNFRYQVELNWLYNGGWWLISICLFDMQNVLIQCQNYLHFFVNHYRRTECYRYILNYIY